MVGLTGVDEVGVLSNEVLVMIGLIANGQGLIVDVEGGGDPEENLEFVVLIA